jgi:hypothetical protein
MTADHLRSHTAKDLAQMARKAGISGWHGMRKEELIRALLLAARQRVSKDRYRARPATSGKKGPTSKLSPATARLSGKRPASSSGTSTRHHLRKQSGTNPQSGHQIDQLVNKLAAVKNLASTPTNNTPCPDNLVVMVRDPYWLHANWELSQRSVHRAQVAMGGNWYQAQPILRLFQVDEDNSSTFARDIPIHGGVNHWYIDVQEPPLNYRLEIGYLAADDSFYCLARSNTVSTPPAGTSDAVDKNWADVAKHADRIYAMSGGYSTDGTSRELQELLEERLNRPLGSPMKTRYGSGAASGRAKAMEFAVDAELIVYGAVDHGAHVTLKGEPIALRGDGTFTVRISMPNRRQVIPIVASSSDGTLQRTISMVVERNTKILELVHRDLTK